MEPFDTFQSNLSYAAGITGSVQDIIDAQYAQIAETAIAAWKRLGICEVDSDRIAALYLTGEPETEPWEIALTAGSLCTADFARFCRCFQEKIPADRLFWRTEEDPALLELGLAENRGGRTAYLQNSYSDKAWKQFADVLPHMTAEYFPGYQSVCEEVYNGRCQYGILPIYTSTDGMLVSFRKLIGKYELKICLETQVEMADESVMRFVLVRRRLSVQLPGDEQQRNRPASEENWLKMNVSAILPEESTIGMLTGAIECFGVKIRAIHTVPLEYTDQIQEYCMETDIPQSALAVLSLFLEASQLRYSVEGLYKTV